MKLADKIGEGHYKECFSIENSNLCAKKLKRYIEKDYLGLKVYYNAKIYVLLKFGIKDLNKKELDIIESLPVELSSYLPSNLKIEDDYLIEERPTDFNDEYSSKILEYGKIKNKIFWKHIDYIVDILEKNELWFLNIFNNGDNILVKKISEDNFQPTIIDWKHLGNEMFPFQINLILKSEQKKKFYRRLNRFKKKFS